MAQLGMGLVCVPRPGAAAGGRVADLPAGTANSRMFEVHLELDPMPPNMTEVWLTNGPSLQLYLSHTDRTVLPMAAALSVASVNFPQSVVFSNLGSLCGPGISNGTEVCVTALKPASGYQVYFSVASKLLPAASWSVAGASTSRHQGAPRRHRPC